MPCLCGVNTRKYIQEMCRHYNPTAFGNAGLSFQRSRMNFDEL
jgi:hypothetical protein